MNDMKPRRLRILEKGLAKYTGPIGQFEFVDGVSVDPIGWVDANRIGSAMQVEDADVEGYRISPAEQMFRIRDVAADNAGVQAVGHAVEVNGEVRSLAERYTKDDLEAIADKRGLAGLREIGAKWGASARSIHDMINRILEAQSDADKTAVENKPSDEVLEE